MRIIVEPHLAAVVRVQASDGPLVVVPAAPAANVLYLAQALLDPVELQLLAGALLDAGTTGGPDPVIRSGS